MLAGTTRDYSAVHAAGTSLVRGASWEVGEEVQLGWAGAPRKWARAGLLEEVLGRRSRAGRWLARGGRQAGIWAIQPKYQLRPGDRSGGRTTRESGGGRRPARLRTAAGWLTGKPGWIATARIVRKSIISTLSDTFQQSRPVYVEGRTHARSSKNHHLRHFLHFWDHF